MIDLEFTNLVMPKKGTVLISNPELHDRIFHRSVIFLCEHDQEHGTIGFILNKKSMTEVAEALEMLDDIPEELYYGGPVDLNGVYILHRSDQILNSNHVQDDMYYGGDMKNLSSLYNTKQIMPNDIRFFLGYSSWIPNQLNFELQKKSWVIYEDVDSDLIFDTPPEELWKKMLYRMGDKYKVFANYPVNPSLN